MYKEFLKLLEKATGRSEHVIAVNLDIRGFTPFCQKEDALNVATYIANIYSKIITGYFKNASFYKPTGDGLIIIIPFTKETLKDVTNQTIDSCLNLLQNFNSLCDGEPMINFPTPEKIGIGVTRGSACCIVTGDTILDYSGRVLNLASRLMDIARPSGIVFDESFGINLLSNVTKKLFSEDTVHIRGVAEETPIKIHYTKKHTLIPESYKQPLREPKWQTDKQKIPFRDFKNKLTAPDYEIKLSTKPLDKNKTTVRITSPPSGKKGYYKAFDSTFGEGGFEFKQLGNSYYVVFNRLSLVEVFEKAGLTGDAEIQFHIIYPIK